MEFSDEIYDKIDKYLTGSMDLDELKSFYEEMKSNNDLAMEVDEQRQVIEIFIQHHENKNLKNKLSSIHKYEFNDKSKFFSKRYVRYIAVISAAACISLLVTFSTMYISGWFSYGKHVEAYSQLNNKIDNLTSTQASIWEAINSSDEQAVPSYPSGTCFVLSNKGYLATNYHVVHNVDSFYIENTADSLLKFKTEIVYFDKLLDIAILQISDSSFRGFECPPYTIKDNLAELGEPVFTLGYSKLDIVYSDGSVSSSTGFNEDSLAFQISIPVNPGNSGGPLFNNDGDIFGIVSGKNTGKDGATFAVKSKYLLQIVDSLSNDTSLIKPELSKNNKIKSLNRKNQISKLKPFVYKVNVYKSN
ncbi:MAG: serine protease [Bacteroidota bacterium]